VEYAKIILLAVAGAVAYGIAHDQITARLCFEYFSVAHPTIIRTNSPTVIALAWGVVATWWMGLALGIPLALAARAGDRPRRSARSLIRPVLTLLAITGAAAAAAGTAGFILAKGQTAMLADLAMSDIPTSRHHAFIACYWAHSASYLVSVAGGLFLIFYVWWWRAKAAKRAGTVSS
jgi:hypothetical protein